jgi:diguanylate cyclase (GGDEF)-like protein
VNPRSFGSFGVTPAFGDAPRETDRGVVPNGVEHDDLLYLATHDLLTGLPNRTLLMDRLGRALAEGGPGHAVLFLDLDDFKAVNDRFGHATGDALLSAVGRRLAETLRPSDTPARFGGDEFVVLLLDVATPQDALSVAERVLRAIRQPFAVNGQMLTAKTSIGVALSDLAHGWPTELLRDADIALYRAKEAGGDRALLFDDDMAARGPGRDSLANELRRAVDQQELRLHYQPEVDLHTGQVRAVEALLRWQHPEHGMIHPVSIIPAAEQTGLIAPVGEWVLREACRQMIAWRGQLNDNAPLTVGVNLSPSQFRGPGLVDQVTHTLRQTGLEPQALRLEITETAMIEHVSPAIETIAALKSLGVQLALDDFGTGYSSLSHLRHFAADVLKIDSSFVQALDSDAKTLAIVQAVIALAHALGMTVVAEGIETSAQQQRLAAMNCDRGQGYLFFPPLPGDDLATALAHAHR